MALLPPQQGAGGHQSARESEQDIFVRREPHDAGYRRRQSRHHGAGADRNQQCGQCAAQ